MEQMQVRALMRPVEDFDRISSRASLLEAVEALERAQEEFLSGRAKQNILLVEDRGGRILGKISPMDVMQGLEPSYSEIDDLKSGMHHGLTSSMLESMKARLRLWEKPLAELCRKACSVHIERFVCLPKPDHTVKADDTMDKALHLFVVGRHDSLFVREGEKIVGLVRFSDVYRKIAQAMKECPLTR